jgi:hypothetical protein
MGYHLRRKQEGVVVIYMTGVGQKNQRGYYRQNGITG